MKRWLLGTHQGAVSDQQLDASLDEFAFRFNCRHSRHRCLIFWRLACNLTEPRQSVTNQQLRQRRIEQVDDEATHAIKVRQRRSAYAAERRRWLRRVEVSE